MRRRIAVAKRFICPFERVRSLQIDPDLPRFLGVAARPRYSVEAARIARTAALDGISAGLILSTLCADHFSDRRLARVRNYFWGDH